MSDWISIAAIWVASGALAATVPVLLIALWVRFVPTSPATRHTLWLIALLWIAAAPPRLRIWSNLSWPVAQYKSHSPALESIAAKPHAPLCDETTSEAESSSSCVPTPPRTGARTTAGTPLSLAQAAYQDERRS